MQVILALFQKINSKEVLVLSDQKKKEKDMNLKSKFMIIEINLSSSNFMRDELFYDIFYKSSVIRKIKSGQI